MYVVAQFLGAIVGFGLLKLLTPSDIFRPTDSVGTCSPSPNPMLNAAQVFFFEYFATTVLIVLCCAAWDPRHAKNQDSMPIKFGLSLSIPFIAVVSLYSQFTTLLNVLIRMQFSLQPLDVALIQHGHLHQLCIMAIGINIG